MYKILLPSGSYLEGEFKLSFELNNQVFSTSDASVLPGSFSFPADIPLSDTNKVLLDHPHLVTNSNNWQTYDGVWVELYGVKCFYGTLKITACGQRRCKVNIVANPVQSVKNVKLNELDLGGSRSLGGDSAAARATAKLSFTTPATYDYIFFPVLNPTFLDSPSGSDESAFQNYYDPSAAAFVDGSGNVAATPFVKVLYLLERMFAGNEFTFENALQTSPELRLLYLWNNRSIYTETPAWGTDIDLRNHVSDMSTGDFLKALMGVFNLGLFTDIFSRKIRLVPLETLMKRPPKHNWTEYVISEPEFDDPATAPTAYAFEPGGDDIENRYTQYRTERLGAWGDVLGIYDDYDTFFADTPDTGLYYVRDKGAYYYHTGIAAGVTFMWQELGAAPAEYTPIGLRTPDRAFLAKLLPTWENMRTYHDLGGGYTYPLTPAMEAQGIVKYTDGPDTIEQNPALQMRLMFYRGTYPAIPSGTYPMGNTLSYNDNGDEPFAYSLRWNGTSGLYNRWWKSWHTALTGKNISLQLALPVADLVAFSFEDKVRIQSMDFFVKKLRVSTPLGNGLVRVEASLVSVI